MFVGRIIRFILVWCILLAIALTIPLKANAQEQRSVLTTEILREKTANLSQKEGRDTIDLSNLIIDLTDSESELDRQFYTEINNAISGAGKPINLNFERSLIQGDFQLDRLGIASYLGEGVLSSLFSAVEQEQIARYYPLKPEITEQISQTNIFRGSLYLNEAVFTGKVDSSNSLFLQSVTARGATFQQGVSFAKAIFGKAADFSQSTFAQSFDLSQSHFFASAKFKEVKFQGIVQFNQSQFERKAEFEGSTFQQLADFARCIFMDAANFRNDIYRDRPIFAKSKFLATLTFDNSTFERAITFRDIYANSLIDLQDVHLLDRMDFSNAFFTSTAKINVSGLAFDAAEAKITGQPGAIGQLLRVDRLTGNQTVLRNLIRNFRSLEQVADANSIEYQQEQLRAVQLSDRLFKVPWRQIFTWTWISLIPQWLGLSLLLLLGDYGTNINSIFGIGIITTAFFSLLFWGIDRYRPKISQPVIPTRYEICVMSVSYLALTAFGIINLLLTTDRPWLTSIAIAVLLFPLPLISVGLIYRRGRYHQLLNTTYFVQNGQYREFQLLLGRLPVIPSFPFFRDRYAPILWDKRWNWLNYYDFSLNNMFKLGFNDIRLRDRHLPGLISFLVWYQWCLGVLYVVLLLWTLSRTIPGLNLLLYF